ncbi:hypothetical protein C7Y47_06415 [Lysinibacillus sphaericus]|uniref:Uncharacterized protein n=1 Tax=Lysinibacillus sphaericus TaxID=1421 RepID=A0A544UPZ5_LYSSH|nr:hypothetical protein [Lysinibacillus sp. SDF0037]TQR35916.1 hypothetical protein C7Y47_06415 [Lysinibacillus sp. SDF0037]
MSEWQESKYFTSENLSFIGERQLLGFTHSKEEKRGLAKQENMAGIFRERALNQETSFASRELTK